ncbi:MHYT domain-containing protein [Paractinoplanes maris]|uniref:MHYT domain-containing protein n=1 Tax=Paractinoplanes maris TaxID=1734446 RepID=UPI002020525E|nr:MHYT domain-containing protein [Actinoplanes maris]
MAEIHHFTYGVFNPIAAFLLAFLGSFFGLLSTARGRNARTRGRRNRWLLIAAFAIGGGAIWLMHFAAMLGFEVPASPVRFDVPMTVLSLGLAVCAVGAGLLMVGHGRRSVPKTLVAGGLTGGGVLSMHYTGMQGMHVAGEMHYDMALVAASAIIAVVASTAALWFTVSVRGWVPIGGAAVIMAIAVCGMHYTGMAAMSVHLDPASLDRVEGFRPLTLILPITLITAATIIGVALSALQAMTEEEFTNGAGTPKRGVHAEPGNPWSLKQATLATPGRRPSPRPVPIRTPTNG